MRVFALELNNDIRGLEERKAYIEGLIARLPKPELVVLPELALCGFIPNQYIWQYADQKGKDTTEWALRMAIKYNTYIGVGYADLEYRDFYNRYMIAGPKGVCGVVTQSEGVSAVFKRGDFKSIIVTPFGKVAVAIGYAVLSGVRHLETLLFPEASVRIFSGFPLFPLCMIGGLVIQNAFQRLRIAPLIDGNQMKRISGASLDFLVVSAIATIRIEVVLQNWLPLLVLIVSGTLLSVLMVLFVAPKLFRDAWFERAIADFGQSLGVTATGLLLLRTVDPENKTEAAAAFGYKQLLHEPFMGGGMVTALALTLVFTIGWLPVFIASAVFFLLWGILICAVISRNRKR